MVTMSSGATTIHALTSVSPGASNDSQGRAPTLGPTEGLAAEACGCVMPRANPPLTVRVVMMNSLRFISGIVVMRVILNLAWQRSLQRDGWPDGSAGRCRSGKDW